MKKKVKKRGIKVPSYLTAGQTGMATNNPLPDYAAQLQQLGNSYARQNQFKMDMLNNDPLAAQKFTSSLNQEYPLPASDAGAKGAKTPKGGGGGANLGSVVSGVGTALNAAMGLVDSFTGESTATTQGEVVGQSLASVGKGAVTGIQAGMSIGGPIGGIVGGALGAITGAIGKKGRYASMTSFTDYDEGTFSTGFRALGGANSRRRRERRRIKANAYDNRDAVRGTSALEADYAQQYGDMGTDTFALGGSTNSLAYVDDGELLRTPDGQISKVPERGKPTDSNLVNIPDGTRILSDSLKVPGTNKTFAQIGEKMIKNKKSKNKDIFAQNAAKLNQLNNEQIYNQLFELQEQVKAAKGIRPKSKQLIPAASGGDEINPYSFDPNLANFRYYNAKKREYDPNYVNFADKVLTQDMLDNAIKQRPDLFSRYLARNPGRKFMVDEFRPLAHDGLYSDAHKATEWMYENQAKLSGALANPSRPDLLTGPITDKPISPAKIASSTSQLPTKLEPIPVDYSRYAPKDKSRGNFDWAGLVGSLSALPGIISDLSTKPEKFDAVYNPYASDIRDVMSGRRYDISAAMAEGKRNRAVSNYNANQFNTNTGANLAYRLQSARNYDNYVAKLRDTKNNVENQYAAEYANTMNDLGRQWVNATNLAVDQNARSRAAAKNINRLGYAGIAQLGQQWAKDYNQRMRDREMLSVYAPFLKSGIQDDYLKLLFRNLPKGSK